MQADDATGFGEDERPSLDDVAIIIANGPSPQWLFDGLLRLMPSLLEGCAADRNSPAPVDLRDRLQDIRRSADLLVREMRPFSASRFQIVKGRKFSEIELDAALKTIKSVSIVASIAADSISPRDRESQMILKNLGFLTPREFCAVVVLIGWEFCHGRLPSPQNDRVQEATDTLWLACLGRQIGRKPEAVGKWRESLTMARDVCRAVRKPPPADEDELDILTNMQQSVLRVSTAFWPHGGLAGSAPPLVPKKRRVR